MRFILAVFLLLFSVHGHGAEWHLLVPQEVNFEAHQIESMNDPYLYPVDKELRYGGVFNTDFAFVQYGRLSFNSTNRVSFEQSHVTGRVRAGGWKFTLNLAMQLTDNQHIELGKYHHSYHIFEAERDGHFPTRDSYYIKFVIYRK